MGDELAEEIGVMVGKAPDHSLVQRLVAVVRREKQATHDAYAGYTDYLTDVANGHGTLEDAL